ncbi:hypothetical protein [Swaminathania salitolerans]|uniref:Uncharacterized protein n=1 Tax=Swaminathania salitolerans TaxID=182838 RepID=A0A511BSR9_9PROT|nr:hypothetical protein [Swaminathania salitolerans]GBQ13215.1 hypothetical protein AA21291_1430 [Swaminathania salitolerans LMG 21291]GEL03371.1 hypothetical protein SSA02_25340 [Swaminathania salitolerans]
MAEKTFHPTKEMASAARHGLRLREKFNRGGTETGVKRAEQLAEQKELSESDIKSMHSYFARHKVDRDTKTHEWGSDSDPSAGYIAWLLWGGDAARDWVERKRETLEDS